MELAPRTPAGRGLAAIRGSGEWIGAIGDLQLGLLAHVDTHLRENLLGVVVEGEECSRGIWVFADERRLRGVEAYLSTVAGSDGRTASDTTAFQTITQVVSSFSSSSQLRSPEEGGMLVFVEEGGTFFFEEESRADDTHIVGLVHELCIALFGAEKVEASCFFVVALEARNRLRLAMRVNNVARLIAVIADLALDDVESVNCDHDFDTPAGGVPDDDGVFRAVSSPDVRLILVGKFGNLLAVNHHRHSYFTVCSSIPHA